MGSSGISLFPSVAMYCRHSPQPDIDVAPARPQSLQWANYLIGTLQTKTYKFLVSQQP